MPARTVKGRVFTIVVDGKRITVKHVNSKGKRCRVIAPIGVIIEAEREHSPREESRDETQYSAVEFQRRIDPSH